MNSSLIDPKKPNQFSFDDIPQMEYHTFKIFLNDQPIAADTIQCIGRGNSKSIYTYGDGQYVFAVQNTSIDKKNIDNWSRMVEDEIKASQELTALDIPTQHYTNGTLIVKNIYNQVLLSENVLVSVSFAWLAKQNWLINDTKEKRWTKEVPQLYLCKQQINDACWNTTLWQEFVVQTIMLHTFKINLSLDSYNYGLNSNTQPPSLHYVLFDFSSKYGSLSFPLSTHYPKLPKINELKGILGQHLGSFISLLEATRLGFKSRSALIHAILDSTAFNKVLLGAFVVAKKKIYHLCDKDLKDLHKSKISHLKCDLILKYLRLALIADHRQWAKTLFLECDIEQKNDLLFVIAEHGHLELFISIVSKNKHQFADEVLGSVFCEACYLAHVPIVKFMIRQELVTPVYIGEALRAIIASNISDQMAVGIYLLNISQNIPDKYIYYCHMTVLECLQEHKRTINCCNFSFKNVRYKENVLKKSIILKKHFESLQCMLINMQRTKLKFKYYDFNTRHLFKKIAVIPKWTYDQQVQYEIFKKLEKDVNTLWLKRNRIES